MNHPSVAAVVVTRNRKKVLAECLDAILNQTHELSALYVVDNASTDGTEKFLRDAGYLKHQSLRYIRLSQNTGGAGGFYQGIKCAYRDRHDWIWIMDDDTIPGVDALEQLMKVSVMEGIGNIGFLCSNVRWTDGSVAIMNVPEISGSNIAVAQPNAGGPGDFKPPGVFPVRSCSFVSLLVRRQVFAKVGYPLKEFFIYADDVEFTRRVSSTFMGLYVPASRVMHKMPSNNGIDPISDCPGNLWKYFYNTRNHLFIEKAGGHARYILCLLRYVKYALSLALSFSRYKRQLAITTLRGCVSSVRFNPRIEYPE